ncbi:MAG: FAD-dependent thymidylate synthase [Deltaproteobacteria bacterium]|nr:MAG: FAD-dependent thymidylate synthase [Deltaproteobacteria bacterium]
MFAPLTVTYIDHMGSDKTVAAIARVSTTTELDDLDELTPRDERLIRYLARGCSKDEVPEPLTLGTARSIPTHWTPFAHCLLTVRIHCSIFVARQLMRSNVGIVYNEMSRRYVDAEPTFAPLEFRRRSDRLKQGSSPDLVVDELMAEAVEKYLRTSIGLYNALLKRGVAPECARAILPLATNTAIVATGSMMAWYRVVTQRRSEHAQKEIRQLASRIDGICGRLWPVSWDALMNPTQENSHE